MPLFKLCAEVLKGRDRDDWVQNFVLTSIVDTESPQLNLRDESIARESLSSPPLDVAV